MDPSGVGVRALDAVTLEVELEGPTGYFMHLISCSALFPIPKHIVETYGEAWTEVGNIVTNGPFRLQAFIPDDHLVLVRNPNYHGHFKGNLQQIELLLAEDMSPMVQSYESDQLDILQLLGIAYHVADRMRQRRAEEYVLYPGAGTSYIGFDVSRPPFDDVRVRRAFAMSIDKETLTHVTSAGFVFPATGGFVPPGIPGHSEGIGLPYDPEKARKLLTEAGYPEGHGFPVIEALTKTVGVSSAKFLRSGWEDILGIEIPWKILGLVEFVDRISREPSQMFYTAWLADYPDPDNFLRTSIPLEATSWKNHVYENLIGTARYTQDQVERMGLYRQADKMLIEEAIVVPLSYDPNHILVKPWVKKFPISSLRWLHGKDVILEPH